MVKALETVAREETSRIAQDYLNELTTKIEPGLYNLRLLCSLYSGNLQLCRGSARQIESTVFCQFDLHQKGSECERAIQSSQLSLTKLELEMRVYALEEDREAQIASDQS